MRAGRMLEIVFGILHNLHGHPELATAIGSHAALRKAAVEGGLCGCEDPVALTAACRFLHIACVGHEVPDEVRCCTLRQRQRTALLMPLLWQTCTQWASLKRSTWIWRWRRATSSPDDTMFNLVRKLRRLCVH